MELAKLRSYLPKIRQRDFFKAQGYLQATEALSKCQQDFQVFSHQVFEAEELNQEEHSSYDIK